MHSTVEELLHCRSQSLAAHLNHLWSLKNTQVPDQLSRKLPVSELASVYIFLKAPQGILIHTKVREQLNL